jgi:hypothetical protein
VPQCAGTLPCIKTIALFAWFIQMNFGPYIIRSLSAMSAVLLLKWKKYHSWRYVIIFCVIFDIVFVEEGA